ncbi:MAG: tetratricopeptide repeat protein [Spirochaetota bacterium]|nr:tetratricopeptide repeat protein [Spirochaetota bacterium]
MRILLYLIITFLLAISEETLLLSLDSKALYEQGMEALNSGNFRSSELLFRKIIESDNEEYKDRAWFNLSLSIFHQKKYKSAIFEFNRFLSICTTSNLCPEARYWIAEAHFFLQEYIKSIEEYKRFISQSKNKSLIAFAYDRIGQVYFIQKRYDEAIIEWERALKRSSEKDQNEIRTLNIAEALFLNQNYNGAINLLRQFILYKVDIRISARARLILGRSYQLKGNHAEAMTIFNGVNDSLLSEKPFYDINYYKAISAIAQNNLNDAKLYFNSFITVGKDSVWYYDAKYELGNIYINEGEESEAIDQLEEVKQFADKEEIRGRALIILSKIYLKRNPKKTIAYLEEAISINNPDNRKEVLFLLGKSYIDVKRYKDAKKTLELLIKDYPYDRDIDHAHFFLSMVYLDEGDMDKAIRGFEKIKEINPFSRYIDESYYYLALAYNRNKQTGRAIDLLKKYLSLKNSQKKYEANVQLLELYLIGDDYKNAKKIMKIVIKRYIKQEGVDTVLLKYGKALKKRGLKAGKYFRLIIKNYPKSASAGTVYLTWGDEAFVKKEFKKAEWFYRKYLSVKGRENAASVFLYRIISLYKMRRYKEIISVLEKEDIPRMDDYTSKQISLWVGRSHYQIGQFEEAYNVMYNWNIRDYSIGDLLIITKISLKVGDIKSAKEASELLQGDKDAYAESLYAFGKYYLEEDEIDISIGYFSRIIIESPTSEYTDLAKVEIAEIYIIQNRLSDAIQQLTEIKNQKIVNRKNAMLIVANFRAGNNKKAISLTKTHLKKLTKTEYGEMAIKENLLYYFNKNNLKEFKKYSWYLKKYKGNNSYINYLSGKIYFDQNKYKSSYYFFYKLAQVKNEYTEESLFYLGIISLFQQKNTERAVGYFNRIIKEKNPTNQDSKFLVQAKIYLSIILKERGNMADSKKILKDILRSSENMMWKTQAENLFEYYGYSK